MITCWLRVEYLKHFLLSIAEVIESFGNGWINLVRRHSVLPLGIHDEEDRIVQNLFVPE